MRTARLFLIFTLVSFGAAFAQSTERDKAPQQQGKVATDKSKAPKASKDTDERAKKSDKDASKAAAKKAENAQNSVNAQAYRTTVPKP